ncbi:fimbrial protein [Enterobacter asburiae]|uniref:fimbrial protein n=1 Tax=Enterobacter asburiae TaxID=61645 RepID=UPI0034E295A2
MKLLTLFPALLASVVIFNVAKAADNVHFSGALVAEPCTLPDEYSDVQLDFGSVILKSLYQYQRTKSLPFTIRLEECDPSLMSLVSVTFEGTPDDQLSTLLALDPSSTAKGVAIGLEQSDGTSLDINKNGQFQQLTQGENTLKFLAYVQIKPDALTNKSVSAGDFSAIATFKLNYQ